MSERLRRLEQIFHAALALPPEERAAWVAEQCAGDPHLRSEIESLLRHAEEPTGGFERHMAPEAAGFIASMSEQRTLAPGTLLGAYHVERVLGQGGMGVVYLATDTRLHRHVAIKTISGDVDDDAAAALLTEARAAASLEYVTGITMREVLSRGPLPDDELASIAAQIAAALEYAHAKQLIHRDLKPENVLLTDEGAIKIIDFGIASAAQRAEVGAQLPLKGTLRYMAPESLAGLAPTTASDVYSAGVLLYEMAVGRHPFAAVDASDLASAIVAGSWTDPEPWLSPSRRRWATVIRRGMALEPSARYRNGADLAAALAGLAVEAPAVGEVSERPKAVVLDFTDITGGDGWLGIGIADTVAADLARSNAVVVATRHGRASAQVSDTGSIGSAAVVVGREQGAQWVIAGTYQQLGQRIRVTPLLIDVMTGTVRPVGKVDGHVDAIFDLQDHVVATLSDALGLGRQDREPARSPSVTRDPLAYEHCARGRQRLYRMDLASLSEAITHFARAVHLDPGYALAHSGLGTAYTLQYLRTSNPDDVARASASLERATHLDPDLGEPYPWLVNIRFRQNDPSGALLAAAKGVALQPDLPEAQYFCGGIHYMLAEHPSFDVAIADERLRACVRLQPLFHPAWIVLGATTMFLGWHAEAVDILTRAIALEAEPALAYRFVGAHTLRGLALARSGEWAAAVPALRSAAEVLEPSAHVYRDTFRALGACTLGGIALRTGATEEALSQYRHARRIVKDAARLAGSQRLLIRVDAGLAAAYAASGDAARGRQLAEAATAQLASVAHTGTITFECGLGQLCLDLAVAECRLGRIDRALELVARALASGWRDTAWLMRDPELRHVRDHRDASALLGEGGEPPNRARTPPSPTATREVRR
jgi:TolB-like protein